ncbi:oligosaccharide flippase family protein [Citrobacter sp. VF227]
MSSFANKKKMIKDVFLGLYILQLFNYVAPVIIIPIIISHIGLDKYGELIYITAIYQVVSLFVDFGFTYTSPVAAARYRNNKEELHIYHTTIIFLKSILFIFALVTVSLLSLLNFIQSSPIYIASVFLCAIGNVFTPLWLFQGLGDFKFLSSCQIITRVLLFFSLLIYLICDGKNLFIISLLQNGSLLLCYFYVRKRTFPINIRQLEHKQCLSEIKLAGNVFVGVLGTISYGSLIPILIGNYCGHVSLGIYSIVQKLTAACQSLIVPVSQYMLSEVSKQHTTSETEFTSKIKQSLVIHLTISSIACVCYLLFGQVTARIIGNVNVSFTIIAISSVITIFSSLNNVLGVQFLIPTDNVRLLRTANIMSGIVVVSISWFMINNYNVLGGVALNLLGELLVFIFLACVAKRKWKGDSNSAI